MALPRSQDWLPQELSSNFSSIFICHAGSSHQFQCTACVCQCWFCSANAKSEKVDAISRSPRGFEAMLEWRFSRSNGAENLQSFRCRPRECDHQFSAAELAEAAHARVGLPERPCQNTEMRESRERGRRAPGRHNPHLALPPSPPPHRNHIHSQHYHHRLYSSSSVLSTPPSHQVSAQRTLSTKWSASHAIN